MKNKENSQEQVKKSKKGKNRLIKIAEVSH